MGFDKSERHLDHLLRSLDQEPPPARPGLERDILQQFQESVATRVHSHATSPATLQHSSQRWVAGAVTALAASLALYLVVKSPLSLTSGESQGVETVVTISQSSTSTEPGRRAVATEFTENSTADSSKQVSLNQENALSRPVQGNPPREQDLQRVLRGRRLSRWADQLLEARANSLLQHLNRWDTSWTQPDKEQTSESTDSEVASVINKPSQASEDVSGQELALADLNPRSQLNAPMFPTQEPEHGARKFEAVRHQTLKAGLALDEELPYLRLAAWSRPDPEVLGRDYLRNRYQELAREYKEHPVGIVAASLAADM